MNPNIHPVEYFGLFIRWKFTQLSGDEKKISFNDFKKERSRFLDFILGFGGVIAVVSFSLIIYSIFSYVMKL